MRIEAGAIKGLADFLESAEGATRPAAAHAMNDVTGGSGLKTYRTEMRKEIAFPAGYLEDVDRFGQSGFATAQRLETKISARARPTSLARFSDGGVGEGVTVRVKAGRTTRLKRAFTVRLRAGAAITADGFNLGLAVRVKPGTVIRNKKDGASAARLAPNVFLLYGPSVDQVFRTVATTATPKVLDLMGAEFLRQFARLST